MEIEKKITPYTTKTGIQIGRFYERRSDQEMSFDMELIQSAFLDDATLIRKERIVSIGYFAAVVVTVFILLLITKN